MKAPFEFSSEELELRYIDHAKLARRYSAAFSSYFGVEVSVNPRRLYLTIISAYEDIARYKDYHLDDPYEQKSDAVKRVSYLTKWICRFKPLSVSNKALDDIMAFNVDKSMLVNELFSLYLAGIHLSVDAKREFIINADKGYEIAYEMMFRHLSEDSYMLLFQMLLDFVTNEREIVQLF